MDCEQTQPGIPASPRFQVIDEGHEYLLQNMDPGEPQTLQFIKKEKNDETGELVTVKNGTTNEALLQVLINRIQYLDAKMSSQHNARAIVFLKEALAELNARTQEREERGVEGTPEA